MVILSGEYGGLGMWIEWERQEVDAEDRRGKFLDNIQLENREVNCRIT
jgi:hypothetical protein